jgi:hypothetical protein
VEPVSRRSGRPVVDPNPPVRFLQSCPTLRPNSFGFYASEAAVRGHQVSANSGRPQRAACWKPTSKIRMAGDHCLHDFTNSEITARLASTQLMFSSTQRSKSSQRQGRPILPTPAEPQPDRKGPGTRRGQVINFARNVMGTTMYLRKHHFPSVYASVVQKSFSPKAKSSRTKNSSSVRDT